MNKRRGPGYWLLAAFFGLFVLFLYGPTLTILVLSFQGPSGGLTFPMNGVSVHWFKNLFEKQMVGDFAGSLQPTKTSSSCWLLFRRLSTGSSSTPSLAITQQSRPLSSGVY